MKYYLKTILSLFFSILFFIQCSNSYKKTKGFTVSGTVKGKDTKELIMYYKDTLNNRVIDTINVIDGYFKTKGYINNPQKVALAGNVKENIYDNPNIARFYIGEDDVVLDLVEDKFNITEVKGSALQNEHIALSKKTERYYKKIDLVIQERNVLQKQVIEGIETFETNNKLKELSIKHNALLDSVQIINLNYVKQHPDSYLSVDILKLYKNSLPKDSLKKWYNNLKPLIKKSYQAKDIEKQLQAVYKIRHAEVGNQAPDFTSKDINEETISLKQFKGKYVLLDFWANWCLPCIEKHPELKRLYNKYHSKGLEIIAISMDKNKKQWREAVEKQSVNWHNIFVGLFNTKDEGSINNLYNVQPIPAYILIDDNGIIIERYLSADKENYKDIDELEKKLEELLAD